MQSWLKSRSELQTVDPRVYLCVHLSTLGLYDRHFIGVSMVKVMVKIIEFVDDIRRIAAYGPIGRGSY